MSRQLPVYAFLSASFLAWPLPTLECTAWPLFNISIPSLRCAWNLVIHLKKWKLTARWTWHTTPMFTKHICSTLVTLFSNSCGALRNITIANIIKSKDKIIFNFKIIQLLKYSINFVYLWAVRLRPHGGHNSRSLLSIVFSDNLTTGVTCSTH